MLGSAIEDDSGRDSQREADFKFEARTTPSLHRFGDQPITDLELERS